MIEIFGGLQNKKIISIFLFIEHLYLSYIENTIDEKYKVKIDENIKNVITNKLIKNKYEYIKELAAAVRRFITRIIFYVKNKDELSPEKNLIIELRRFSLWDKKLRNEEIIEKILTTIIEFNLTVGQSYEFYQIIKEEDEKEIILENNEHEDYIPKRKMLYKKRFKY